MRSFFLTIISLMIFLSFSLPATESEEIAIRLGIENQLIPVYLTHVLDENSGFFPSYLKQLEEVLTFDLNYNGSTRTAIHSPEAERTAQKAVDENSNTFNAALRNLKVNALIKASVSSKKLSVKLVMSGHENAKSISGIPLQGELTEDRKRVHQMADAIYKALFDHEGIATTHVLYAVKKQLSDKRWVSEIWQADYDGKNAHKISTNEGYHITPSYLPAAPGHLSSYYIYVSYSPAQPKIYLASLKKGMNKRLVMLKGNQLTPTISRQRDLIAFSSDITGNPTLFLQSFSAEEGTLGKPRQILSGRKFTQGSPVFSKNGKQMAYVSNKDGSPRIYLMDIPAQGVPVDKIKSSLLIKQSSESSAPAWSPDGFKLAYCAKVSGIRQIWVYDFKTKKELQLTQGPGNKENPSWTANSLCLIYNMSLGDTSDLYLTTIHEPEPIKITSGSGEKKFPNCEPRN